MNRDEVLMLRAPPVLLLLLLLVIYGFLSPPGLAAQDPDERLPAIPSKGYRLEQNYPSPANPDTWIPFILEENLFSGGGARVVTLRIVNLFGQHVATPRAFGHPRGNVPVANLGYTEPGRKLAYWDGKDLNGRRAPSAIYYCVLIVGDQEPVYSRIRVVNQGRRGRIFPFFRRRN
jgi:hypothetical protein